MPYHCEGEGLHLYRVSPEIKSQPRKKMMKAVPVHEFRNPEVMKFENQLFITLTSEADLVDE